MSNRARLLADPETLVERFGAQWLSEHPIDIRSDPQELAPFVEARVIRQDDRGRGIDVMEWDILGGQAKRSSVPGSPPRPLAMTNIRTLSLPQWRPLAERPEQRCLIPLTEFCEWSRNKDPVRGIKGEMWFNVVDQPIFAVAGLWQTIGESPGFAVVTCDPNELVAPIRPKAMITILKEDHWDRWLTGGYEEVVALQQPYPANLMSVRGPMFPERAEQAPTSGGEE